MPFKDVLGQDEPIGFLKTALRRSRVAHAYLFVGPQGVGKARAAQAFAELLLCPEAQAEEACGVCASCLKVCSGQHPDVQRVFPEDGVIKIDAVREACRSLSLRGFESPKKVLIVDGAQYLNGPSANALLKTLEEPVGHAVILLIADSLKSVLPTIVSRCQRVMFRALTVKAIVSVLTAEHGVGLTEALYLAQMAQGSLGRALSYRQENLVARRDVLLSEMVHAKGDLRHVAQGEGKDRREKQEHAVQTLDILASWYRDVLVSKFLSDADFLINTDRREDVLGAGAKESVAMLERKIVAVAQATADIEQNANINLSLAKLKAELWKT